MPSQSDYKPLEQAPSANSANHAVLVRGLHKSYGATEAVRGVSLDVAHGEIFAFLGPNGAGKTTTVEILEGFVERSHGDVSVLGVDPQHGGRTWRDRLGIVLQESAPDPGLTAAESLRLYAGYYARPLTVDAVLSLVGLEAHGDQPATTLSGGERRRLDLALALIGDPELIFLDEPTTGFDPAARRIAWDVITGLRSLGKTIFLTTHYMEEAEALADRIAIITAGRVVAEGDPVTLGGRDRAATTVAFALPVGSNTSRLPASLTHDIRRQTDGRFSVSTTTPLRFMEQLAAWSRATGTPVTDLEATRPTLEATYLMLTGSTIEEHSS